MNLLAFKQKLETMDWTYDYSEDYGVWKRGHAQLSELLKVLSGDKTLLPLFREYSKKYPNQIVLNSILKNSGLT